MTPTASASLSACREECSRLHADLTTLHESKRELDTQLHAVMGDKAGAEGAVAQCREECEGLRASLVAASEQAQTAHTQLQEVRQCSCGPPCVFLAECVFLCAYVCVRVYVCVCVCRRRAGLGRWRLRRQRCGLNPLRSAFFMPCLCDCVR